MKKRNIQTYNRTFSLILYEEDEKQMKALEYIRQNYKYAAILHTEDIIDKTTQEKKKAHYHVVLYIGKNPRNRDSIAKELEIAPNYIEGCNKKKMLLYLIHYENPEKYQYTTDIVEGPLKNELEEIIIQDIKSDNEKLNEVIDLIENETIYDSFSLMKAAIKMDSVKLITKNQYILTKMIYEKQRSYK